MPWQVGGPAYADMIKSVGTIAAETESDPQLLSFAFCQVNEESPGKVVSR